MKGNVEFFGIGNDPVAVTKREEGNLPVKGSDEGLQIGSASLEIVEFSKQNGILQ